MTEEEEKESEKKKAILGGGTITQFVSLIIFKLVCLQSFGVNGLVTD